MFIYFQHLLPAFPPQGFDSEQAEEFIGDVLDSYIESAKFYEHEVNKILMSYRRTKRGMTKEEKIEIVRELLSDY